MLQVIRSIIEESAILVNQGGGHVQEGSEWADSGYLMYVTICLHTIFCCSIVVCRKLRKNKNINKKSIQCIILGAGLVTDLLHPKCRGEPYRMPFLRLGFVTHSPSGEVTFNYCTLMQFFRPAITSSASQCLEKYPIKSKEHITLSLYNLI